MQQRASFGVIIEFSSPKFTLELKNKLPPDCKDSNQAEYAALLFLLQYARMRGYKKLRVQMDAEVVVKQIRGKYKCPERFIPMHDACLLLIKQLDFFRISYIPREQNGAAHALAAEALQNRH